jgi:diguanylate cyclase (GGDEF)-like protein
VWRRPEPRVLALTAALATAALLLVRTTDGSLPVMDVPAGPWLWLGTALLFLGANRCTFVVEVRGNAHSYTLTEIPVALGVFLLTPGPLVLAAVAGGLGAMLVMRRSLLKTLFNLALFGLDTAFAAAIFHTLTDPTSSARRLWLVAMASVMAAAAVANLCVLLVIKITGTPGVLRMVPSMLTSGFVQSFVSTATALLMLITLHADPWAPVLVVLLGAIPVAAYRAHAGLSQRHRRLQRLYDFTRQLSHSARPEDAVRATLLQALELLRAAVAEVHLTDPRSGGPVVVRMTEDSPTTVPAVLSSWDHALAATGEIVVPRGTKDLLQQELLAGLGCRDVVAVPLVSAEGRLGTLVARDRTGETGSFTEQDLSILGTLAMHVSAALTSARLLSELRIEAADKEHQSLHDALTGLGNRSLFAARAQELLAGTGRPAAVLLLDLNRFKDVNDTLGHAQGDRLLQEVAHRLRAAVPDGATLARLGGDEFVLLVPDPRSTADVVDIAWRLVATLERPMQLDVLTVSVGAAVGIALAPDHGRTADELLQRADIAMYVAKEARTSAVQLYDHSVDAQSDRRLALAADLRVALDSGQIEVFYQPQCSLSDGRVRGAEALARWQHPEHGFVSPEEFIPLAESVGLIRRLTEHVLRTSVLQVKEWAAQGIDTTVAVNLSAQSLMDVSLPDEVVALLTELDVAPRRLTLEVTEGHIMRDPDRAVKVLERLAGAGIRLSIDDFGTGYSSLAYLRDLPVHEVKIDKSFVMGMTTERSDATIVRSVVDLARNLDLESVAEGVEDLETWELLRGIGCHTAQGYLLSRPVPAAEATRWLLERTARPVPAEGPVPALPQQRATLPIVA